MTDLQNMAREFLALRRSLGYKLVQVEAQLNEFVTFLDSKSAAYVTTQLALAWVLESARGAIGSYKHRLYVVRSFANWTKPLRGIRVAPGVQRKEHALSNLASAFL